jgi:hypothetical protein
MTILNIYYKEDTGDIHSFQGGDALTPQNEIPKGCKRVAFGGAINIWDAKTHRVIYRVNTETKKLELITDAPVEEKEMLSELEKKLIVMQNDLRTAKGESDLEFVEYLNGQLETLQNKIDRIKAEQSHVQTHIT